ncbi:hypothetical protein [Streptomyces sp. NPDC000405]|uniref:hypothetical protein n=1 Tax=Streptomyces sp. NPDC000405 TaxID=3161033 RepID=UPI00398D308F
MSDWAWEYEPDAENAVGGLSPVQSVEVETIAQRIAEAVGVRRIGKPLTSPSRHPASGLSLRAP